MTIIVFFLFRILEQHMGERDFDVCVDIWRSKDQEYPPRDGFCEETPPLVFDLTLNLTLIHIHTLSLTLSFYHFFFPCCLFHSGSESSARPWSSVQIFFFLSVFSPGWMEALAGWAG
jgi:hypothetical protein